MSFNCFVIITVTMIKSRAVISRTKTAETILHQSGIAGVSLIATNPYALTPFVSFTLSSSCSNDSFLESLDSKGSGEYAMI